MRHRLAVNSLPDPPLTMLPVAVLRPRGHAFRYRSSTGFPGMPLLAKRRTVARRQRAIGNSKKWAVLLDSRSVVVRTGHAPASSRGNAARGAGGSYRRPQTLALSAHSTRAGGADGRLGAEYAWAEERDDFACRSSRWGMSERWARSMVGGCGTGIVSVGEARQWASEQKAPDRRGERPHRNASPTAGGCSRALPPAARSGG